MNPTFFDSPPKFRAWLLRNHDNHDELWVGYYKKASGIPSITWPESVEQALCFGWIDGIRKSIDETRYMIRFTPRRPTSHWSRVNLETMQRLIADQQVQPSGMAAYERRTEKRSQRYSFEQSKAELPKEYQKRFRSEAEAWKYFQQLAPSYRKASTWWVISAKRKETQLRRLDKLIQHSAQGEKLPQLISRPAVKKKK